MFTQCYKIDSAGQKGTLANIAERYDRRNVRQSVKSAVDEDEQFIKFVTHGLVILCAVHIMGLDSMKDSPEPGWEVNREGYFNEIAGKIVDMSNLSFELVDYIRRRSCSKSV